MILNLNNFFMIKNNVDNLITKMLGVLIQLKIERKSPLSNSIPIHTQ